MKSTLKKMLRESAGQDLAEYGIGLAVVAVAVTVAAATIAVDTKTLWTRALQAIVVATLG
jgi:Flp pilus assembly pilin Flp